MTIRSYILSTIALAKWFLNDLVKIMSCEGLWRIQGGAMGAKPPPGPVKSIDFRGFSGPNGC